MVFSLRELVYISYMKKECLLLLLAGVMAVAGWAQPSGIIRADGRRLSGVEVDSLVGRLMDAAEVTGLCIGIVQDGQPVLVRAYGYRNRALGERNDTATCFYAASLSKAVFARLVMQLVDEGRIDLDKPLYSYLPKPIPEYANYKDLVGDDRWKLITARMCLDHTTGFPNWRQFNPRGNNKLEIFFTPGQRYAYSGEGLYLLQLVVETITGRPLEDLAREKIFQPLGMRRTSYVWQPEFERDYAVGHDMNQDTLRKRRRSTANAAGSMETTIADYTRFMAAMMRRDGLSAGACMAMWSPQIPIYSRRQFPSLDTAVTDDNTAVHLSYGLGWGVFDSKYGKAVFKEGHDDCWQHYTIGFPDKRLAFVLMANSDFGESIYKELVEQLSGVVIPWYWEGYTPYRPMVRLPDSVMPDIAGKYEAPDGKIRAVITLVNGRLKVASETFQLPPTNLYAGVDGHFFLKTDRKSVV